MKTLTLPQFVVSCAVLLLALAIGCSKQSNDSGTAADGDTSVAEARQRSRENLERMNLGFETCALRRNDRIPLGYLDQRTGRVGLSWRVELLEWIAAASDDSVAREAGLIFDQFRLNEPWDSEHNKKLIPKMPKIYAPVRGTAPEGHTFYQGFASAGNTFQFIFLSPEATVKLPPDTPVHEHGVPFAVALPKKLNTHPHIFLVVEAGEAVPWTKPQDIIVRYDEKFQPQLDSLPKLGGLFDGDFHVLMGNGSIQYVNKDVPRGKLAPFIDPQNSSTPDYAGIGLKSP